MTDNIKKVITDLRARARVAISEEATDALNAAADTLEAEHQRAEDLEKNRASWIGDAMEYGKDLETERDTAIESGKLVLSDMRRLQAERGALHTAIQEVMSVVRPESLVYRILSRAIDTKEKSNDS